MYTITRPGDRVQYKICWQCTRIVQDWNEQITRLFFHWGIGGIDRNYTLYTITSSVYTIMRQCTRSRELMIVYKFKIAANVSHGCSSIEESTEFVNDFVKKCFEIRQLDHTSSKVCNGCKPPTSIDLKWSKNNRTIADQNYTNYHFYKIYPF